MLPTKKVLFVMTPPPSVFAFLGMLFFFNISIFFSLILILLQQSPFLKYHPLMMNVFLHLCDFIRTRCIFVDKEQMLLLCLFCKNRYRILLQHQLHLNLLFIVLLVYLVHRIDTVSLILHILLLYPLYPFLLLIHKQQNRSAGDRLWKKNLVLYSRTKPGLLFPAQLRLNLLGVNEFTLSN